MERATRALEARCPTASEIGHEPPAMTAGAIVGGIESTLRSRLRAEGPVELESLLAELSSFAVVAYLGPEAAAEELDAAAVSA
jgi:hypothetical protein